MCVILVIDEHSVYRSGIRELIEGAIQHAHVVEALEFGPLADSQYFDLVLIDSNSLSYRLLDLLKEFHELHPTTRFAVMSSSNTRANVLNCLSAGFHGFVHKLQSDEELLTAINDLLSGRIYVPRWIADRDDETPELSPSIGTAVQTLRLTPRQHEILPLIAQGMSNKEIATLLNISEGTTKIHTAALLHALGARNRTEAAFIAAKLAGLGIRAEGLFLYVGAGYIGAVLGAKLLARGHEVTGVADRSPAAGPDRYRDHSAPVAAEVGRPWKDPSATSQVRYSKRTKVVCRCPTVPAGLLGPEAYPYSASSHDADTPRVDPAGSIEQAARSPSWCCRPRSYRGLPVPQRKMHR